VDKLNNKGQFSIIAALLVAVVLVAAVMTTYSAIRYSPVQAQPQILSAVDETNQALKQLLGFTVGYYGSVLKVTGNLTYAQQLAKNYLNSGLANVGFIKPEWGLSLNISDLTLKTNWFTNESYSQGTMQVTYDLNGLGITGMSYSASSRLEVQISNASSPTQAQFKILKDDGEPLINLGTNNIKFYRYVYQNLTWEFSVPTSIISHGDGTYTVDLPSGVSSSAYVVQVDDTRGISVLASSFNEFTSVIAWNTTAFKPDLHYVDSFNLNDLGTHSNFAAQQDGPNGVFDTLTEAASPDATNYAINLTEQWVNLNATNIRQDLCIKTGNMGSEPLLVQVLHGGTWQNLMTLIPNYFNNASLHQYIDSTTLTIRFVGSNDIADPTQNNWSIDAVFIKDEPDINFLVNLQQSTFTLEVLQNGTMRWLGQNTQLTTQTLPIPPIPVKAIHVNQTINGLNREVAFQIEDWASNYQIPLGLTSNSTVFGNRQMIVFLLNSKVTDFTVWWNGSDAATQTSLAYTNKYFTNDNTNAATLKNGNVTLLFGNFNVKSTVGTTSSTANFMRINQQASTYGAGIAYVIHHGVVRDVVQQEAEWNNGATGCPNLYANIVLTLPANATYYTYQLRIMFINSTQARSITDLSPIQLTTTLSSPQLQTENGTLAGFPILQNGTGTFLNSTIGSWTQHHFSQFTQDNGKGAGIMFTDTANQKLYAFDSFSGSTSNGALKASSGLIELLPVSSSQVQFTSAYDITWQGAVATFDGTTPVCSLYDGTTPAGLWLSILRR
jgi:uncharacterized protein (UPF0333 family)